MHEKRKTWKREFGFDRIETCAEVDEKRFRTSTSPVPDPFFNRSMVARRRPHTPDEFTLKRKVDVESLRMEIIFSQPASSQCDPSSRRAVVVRGQKNPERRHGRPRSVRGRRNPEHRDPLLKPVKMVFEFKLHKHGSGVCFASSSARRRGRQRERNYC